MIKAVLLHVEDNVAVCLAGVRRGDVVGVGEGKTVDCRTAVPRGHKISVRDIRNGSEVVKYGQSIGIASADIQPGEHVHIHNCLSTRARRT